MITKKTIYRPENRPGLSISAKLFGTLLLLGMLCLPFLAGADFSNSTHLICGAYLFISIVFFAAQIIGFVVAHTRYYQSVEEPKFRLLDIEKDTWKHLKTKTIGLPCLVCGVDSQSIQLFLYLFAAGALLGSCLIFLWSWASGRFRYAEKNARLVFDAENRK